MKTQSALRPFDLLLVVAHAPEAAPLIELLQLRPLATRPFKIYGNKDVGLIISGMGKIRAATATAYLAGLSQQSGSDGESVFTPACLNVGIAGHGAREVGEAVLVSKLTDATSTETFYPTPLALDIPVTELQTVDQPQLDYPAAIAYDMEASGFYRAASAVTQGDLIQVLKLISDSPQQDVSQIDKALVKKLYDDNIGIIMALVAWLLETSGTERELRQPPAGYLALREQLDLSVTQGHQLRRLSERCMALGLEAELDKLAQQKTTDARRVLQHLHGILAEAV